MTSVESKADEPTAEAQSTIKKVCVTGGSGFIASHIVRLCLEHGYEVNTTVRDASDEAKTAHLRGLPGAAERLNFFSANLLEGEGAFLEPFAECDGVFHVASPLIGAKDLEDAEALVIKPAVEGTLSALRAAKKAGVKTVVITSSTSSIAPFPEPAVKTEEHWSDPDRQRERGSYYSASKTLAEKAAWKFVEEEGKPFRLVAMCPTMVTGPMLQPATNSTMDSLLRMLKNGRSNGRCPNDSMSFIDVRDCAAQHVAAMENEQANGRYMSLQDSVHWNDLELLMREINPNMPKSEPCEGEPCKPTKVDRTRQDSLGVECRKVPEILREGYEELKRKGLID